MSRGDSNFYFLNGILPIEYNLPCFSKIVEVSESKLKLLVFELFNFIRDKL